LTHNSLDFTQANSEFKDIKVCISGLCFDPLSLFAMILLGYQMFIYEERKAQFFTD
jgi:hypothetical protein